MLEIPDRPFRYRDLGSLGWSRADLATALEAAVVRQVFRGVYLATALTDDLRPRLEAVRLGLGPAQIACDRTAAWIHGIDLYRFGEYDGVPRLEICVVRGRTRTRITAARGMTRDLRRADVEEVAGLRTTTPLRTALDLGCVLRRNDALAALDQYRRLYGLTETALVLEAERYRGRRGVRQLRTLIPLSDPRAESIRETWTRLAVLDAGLPLPELQYWWNDVFRLDMAYPRLRIAIEYDGEEFHRRTPEQIERDRRRRTLLAEDGWALFVVRKEDLYGVRLEHWTRELGLVVAERSRDNRRW